MLGEVRFNKLGANTSTVAADARRAKKEKLLAARQRLENDLAEIEKEEDEDIGADLLNKMNVASQYQDTDSEDDDGNNEPMESEKEKEKEKSASASDPSQSSHSDKSNIIRDAKLNVVKHPESVGTGLCQVAAVHCSPGREVRLSPPQ